MKRPAFLSPEARLYIAHLESRIETLQLSDDKLTALEFGGVDNWTWYSESITNWCRDNKDSALAKAWLDEEELDEEED